MKSVLTLVFILLFSFCVYSQEEPTVIIKQSTANAAAEAFEKVPKLELAVKALEQLVAEQKLYIKEMETNKKTPCSIAIESVNATISQAIIVNTNGMSDRDAAYHLKTKEKYFKHLLKQSRQVLSSPATCNIKTENQWMNVLRMFVGSPLLYLIKP